MPFLLGVVALATAVSLLTLAQVEREGELAHIRAEFVASVSHELRTPLAQIQLEVDTLRIRRQLSEEDRSASLQRMARETRRLAHLIENMLRFSRSGWRRSLHRVPTVLSHDVAQTVDEFRPLAACRRAVLMTDIEPTPPLLLEADFVRQIVANLLDNAVKYGPPGQTIHVGVRVLAGGVRLSVADEGPGVPVSEREHIWQPFVRGSAAGSRREAGTGIGLTLVRDAVLRNGGRAWVADVAPDRGHGARFEIEIPLGEQTNSAPSVAQRASSHGDIDARLTDIHLGPECRSRAGRIEQLSDA